MPFHLHVAPLAEADIDDILLTSMMRFGLVASEGYTALIEAPFQVLVSDPECAGSHVRPELGPAVRSIHLRTVRDHVGPDAQRVRAPVHIVFYRVLGETVHICAVRGPRLLRSDHSVIPWAGAEPSSRIESLNVPHAPRDVGVIESPRV